jgi:hypothetical protein
LKLASGQPPARSDSHARSVKGHGPKDRLRDDVELARGDPLALLPPPERRLVDPDELRKALPREPLGLASTEQAGAERLGRVDRAESEEVDDLREEADRRLRVAALPVVDRGDRDAVCNGKVPLPEASRDALPAEVLAPRSRLRWEPRI